MRRFVATCSVVFIAIAVLGACGSSSKGTASPDTKKPGTSGTTGSGSSSNDDYAKLVADAQKARFKVTYTNGSGSGSDQQTYAQDGKGNSVYGSGNTLFFTSADGSVSCDTDSSGKATCTSVPGVGSGINPFLTLFQAGKTAIDSLGGSYGDVSSKTVAGRDAKCLTISVGASVTYCIDKDTGVLLEFSTKTGGKEETSFKVTKFEQPSDSDFTPPATPQTVPGYTVPSIPSAPQ